MARSVGWCGRMVLVGLWVMLSPPAQAGLELPELLPPDTLAYGELVRPLDLPEALVQLPLWRDAGAVRPALEAAVDALPAQAWKVWRLPRPMLEELPPVARVQLAVTAVNPRQGLPLFLMVVSFEDPTAITEIVPGWGFLQEGLTHDGVQIQRVELTSLNLHVAVLAGELVISSDLSLSRDVITAAAEGRALSLSSYKLFNKVRARCGADADAWAYVNLRQVLDLAQAVLPPDQLDPVDRVLELREWRALGGATRVEGTPHTEVILFMGRDSRLIELLGRDAPGHLLRRGPGHPEAFVHLSSPELERRLESLRPLLEVLEVPASSQDEPGHALLEQLAVHTQPAVLQAGVSELLVVWSASDAGGPSILGLVPQPDALDPAWKELIDKEGWQVAGERQWQEERSGGWSLLENPLGWMVARQDACFLMSSSAEAAREVLRHDTGSLMDVLPADQGPSLLQAGIGPRALGGWLGNGPEATDFLQDRLWQARVQVDERELRLTVDQPVLAMWMVYLLAQRAERHQRELAWGCRNRMDRVGQALRLYLRVQRGFPTELASLRDGIYLSEEFPLHCPLDDAQPHPAPYRYFPLSEVAQEERWDLLLATCPHLEHGGVVLYGAGYASWIPVSQYHQLVEQTRARLDDR